MIEKGGLVGKTKIIPICKNLSRPKVQGEGLCARGGVIVGFYGIS